MSENVLMWIFATLFGITAAGMKLLYERQKDGEKATKDIEKRISDIEKGAISGSSELRQMVSERFAEIMLSLSRIEGRLMHVESAQNDERARGNRERG